MTRGNRLFRRTTTLTVTLLAATALAACGTTGAKKESSIRLATYPANLPQWCDFAAIDQGFYKDAGVKVGTPLTVQSDADALRALQSGEANIGQVSTVLQAVSSGKMTDPPIMIAQESDLPASFVGPGKPGDGLSALKSLKIALPPEGQATTAVAVDALNTALGPKGYTPIFVGGGSSARVAALASGRVDAAFVFAPLDRQAIKKNPKLNILGTIDGGPTRYGGGFYVADEKWLKKNKALVRSWAGAYVKGCEWVQDPKNKAATVEILAKRMKLDTDVVEATYDDYIGNGKGRSPSATGVVDRASVDNVQQALIRAGYQKETVDIDSLIDNSYVSTDK